MKITRASDYAIRLLTYLAEKGGEATSEKIAPEIDVPFNHLAKLVPMLARKGYLLSRKGKGGGIKLAVSPKEINIADIITAIEGPMVISDCIFNRKSCRFSEKCKMRKCLYAVRYKIEEILSKTTVFDLVIEGVEVEGA